MHADIFFFITTIAVVIFTALMIIVGVYVIITLRDVRDLVKVVKDEAIHLVEDVEDFRENAKVKIRVVSKILKAFASTAFIKALFGKKKG